MADFLSEIRSSAPISDDKAKVMELIDFSQFTSRRAARAQPRDNAAVAEAPIFDLWADLHSAKPEPEAVEAQVIDMVEADFWNDLQFRLAYPTHRLRRH